MERVPLLSRAVALLAVLATLVALTPPARAAAQPPIVFVVGTVGAIGALNPLAATGSAEREAYALIYDTLTGYAPSTGLASSWETSTDGRVWTYHLRAGLTWSDGRPLTARDVVYTFQRVRAGANPTYRAILARVSAVTAPDEETVVITTRTPDPTMARIPVPILPEHVWRTVDAASPAGVTAAPVGSGPFTLVDHRPTELRFAANARYAGATPKVGEVVLRTFRDAATMADALGAGDIDLAHQLPAEPFEMVKDRPGVTTVVSRTAGVGGLAVNVAAGHPALRDVRVRQALAHGMDGRHLVDAALGGYGEVAAGLLSSRYAEAVAAPDRFRHDVARAQRLLDEAGYPRGPDGVRRHAESGLRLQLRLLGRRDDPVSERTVQLAAGWLTALGVAPEAQLLTAPELALRLGTRRYDLVEWRWEPGTGPAGPGTGPTSGASPGTDAADLLAEFTCAGPGFYCDATYEGVFRAQATMIDPIRRSALLRTLQAQLHEDLPYLPLYHPFGLEAYRSDRFTNLAGADDAAPPVFGHEVATYLRATPVARATGEDPAARQTARLVVAGTAALLALFVGFTFAFRRRPPPRRRF